MANVSRLQTTADLDASQIAGAASALLPSGVVLPFAGATPPSGWLLCDGSEWPQATYANLFNVLSTTYNTQINPTTGLAWIAPAANNFRVPDYRGIFLRGVGTASGKDAVTLGGHQTEKTKAPVTNFSTSAQTVTGSITETSALSNSNNIISSSDVQASKANNTYGATGFNALGSVTASSATLAHSHTISHTLTAPASTVSGGDNETRPINKGVNYIIKI